MSKLRLLLIVSSLFVSKICLADSAPAFMERMMESFASVKTGDAKNFQVQFIKKSLLDGVWHYDYSINGVGQNAISIVEVNVRNDKIPSANVGILVPSWQKQFPYFSMMFIEVAFIQAFQPEATIQSTKNNSNTVFSGIEKAESKAKKGAMMIELRRGGVVWSKNYVNDGKYHGVFFKATR